MADVRLGPDAARYILAGDGDSVAFPFNLRVLWPTLCEDSLKRWRILWLASWPVLAAGAVLWATAEGASTVQALAAAAFLLALPGVWGPISVRPVGVDLPTMALAIWSAAAFAHGWTVLGVVIALVATFGKEHAPVWIALWAWTPWALVALAVVPFVYLINRPAMDSVTATPLLRDVHDHPIRQSIEHHRGQWRNAWFMVAPWGVTLAALYDPSPWVLVALAVAYGQLIVATDTVRLYQSVAGPVMALAAALVIPTPWLLLAVAVHVVWWRDPVVG